MRIRMLGSNCGCWKRGDEFDVHIQGGTRYLMIVCLNPSTPTHMLTDDEDQFITDISQLADIHEVI